MWVSLENYVIKLGSKSLLLNINIVDKTIIDYS